MSTAHHPTPKHRSHKSRAKVRTKPKTRTLSPALPAQDQPHKAASLFLDPAFQAFVALSACEQTPSQTTPAALLDEMNELARSVSQGDLNRPEKIALTQATVLDVLLAKLTGLAFANPQGPHFDTLIRLAFRAQSQCARTLETLATLKNPAVIAHQLNVAHQQFVAGAGAPAPSLPPSQAALPNSETIVRLAGSPLSPTAHEAPILR